MTDNPSSENQPLIEAAGLVKEFHSQADPGTLFRAVDNVSLHINRGEAFGLVGESGSGKSTTGRLLLRLIDATSGTIRFNSKSIDSLNRQELLAFRRRAQIIFQDPYSSLNPRMTAGQIISEPLRIHKMLHGNGRSQTNDLLLRVGLNSDSIDRYPYQFSGGQRQRISIARAIAIHPDLLIADEPVSALDVSVQAQIINLLRDLQQEMGLGMLFISHNLAVVRYLCHRTAVMTKGCIVEEGPTENLFSSPQHEYTRRLIGSFLD